MKGVAVAQIELRFFDPEIPVDIKRAVATEIVKIVFSVHYPNEIASRAEQGALHLMPGDVTLVVPVIDTELSQSDAQFEAEITEGSSNWPQTQSELQERADRISNVLASRFEDVSHNIFEVNGLGTGWVQYTGGKK